MYYEQGMQQQKIATKLGLSNMAVSRLLQKAREEHLVTVSIRHPFTLNEELARRVEERYGLRKSVVVETAANDRAGIRNVLAQVCAFHLGMLVADNSILGFGLGATIGEVMRQLVPMRSTNVHVVQLIGGLEDIAYTNPLTIVQEASTRLQAQGMYFSYPAIVLSREQRDSIFLHSPLGKKMTSMWEHCTTAVFGVGSIDNGYLSQQLVTQEEIERNRKAGIIGDILGHCFNRTGEFVATELADRLVSIPLDMLKRVPERMAVAGGVEKTAALTALLSVGMLTTLVTDENTAARVLGDH